MNLIDTKGFKNPLECGSDKISIIQLTTIKYLRSKCPGINEEITLSINTGNSYIEQINISYSDTQTEDNSGQEA